MKKLNVLTRMLLLVALLVGSTSSVWAAPGDEIKSPSNVVSGKWYYIKICVKSLLYMNNFI